MASNVFDLEYTVCLIQSGQFSVAAKSHRREGGSPQLEIMVGPSGVTWRLTDLDRGQPELVVGQPQVNRVDFYFILEGLRADLHLLPLGGAAHDPSVRLAPTTSEGTERREGKRVRLVMPICRFFPIESVYIHKQQAPSCDVSASLAYLHLDLETGPARIYGTDILEVHFGLEADYILKRTDGCGRSHAEIRMSRSVYATVLRELNFCLL